jgi:hypothetical protein
MKQIDQLVVLSMCGWRSKLEQGNEMDVRGMQTHVATTLQRRLSSQPSIAIELQLRPGAARQLGARECIWNKGLQRTLG